MLSIPCRVINQTSLYSALERSTARSKALVEVTCLLIKYLVLVLVALVLVYRLPTYSTYVKYMARREQLHEDKYLARVAEYNSLVDSLIEAERKLHELDYVPLTEAYIQRELALNPYKPRKRKRG